MSGSGGIEDETKPDPSGLDTVHVLFYASTGHILLDEDAVVDRVGLNPEKLRQITIAASSGDFFAGALRLARSDVSDEEIHSAAVHLREFKGQGNWSVTFENVRRFIEQFPRQSRNAALELIKSFVF